MSFTEMLLNIESYKRLFQKYVLESIIREL